MASIFEQQLIYDKINTGENPFAHCSNITQLNQDTLMAQWYSGKAEQSKNQSIWASKYKISEKKWSNPKLICKTTEYPEGNGVLWKDPRTNTLFLFFATMWTHSFIKKSFGRGWHYCKLFWKTSNDDGETWSEKHVMHDDINYMYRNKPIILKSGRILLPMYQEMPTKSFMAISDDFGKTFRFSKFIEDHPRFPYKHNIMGGSGCSQPTIVETETGRIIALFRTTLHKKIFRAVSDDQGESWSYAEPINLPNPDSGIDMIRLKNGKMVLLFNNAVKGRHNLAIATSKDLEGLEWEVIHTLEDSPKMTFSYPAIIQTTDGMIHATYTYARKTIKHIYFNEEFLNEKI